MALIDGKTICLKSLVNNKHLRFQNGRVQMYALLQFSADDVLDPYAQLDVVKSSKDNDLFHLKCCYNKKYLVRWGPHSNWISASANSPIEDQTNWACTLFKPIVVGEEGGNKTIKLVHVQLGHYLSYGTVRFSSYLYAGSDVPDPASKQDVMSVINWGPTLSFTMPRKVAFKGTEGNGKYLGSTILKDKPYVQMTFDNVQDPKVAHEIIPSEDGFICIKSTYFGKFWRVDPDDYNKIVVDLRDDPRLTNNKLGMFRFSVFSQPDRIGLLNAQNFNYCKAHNSNETGSDYLIVAYMRDVDNWTPLQIIDI
ncbi:uncharacterized protein LOC141637825 [Silene latifolia]|uniref:uncharacterized protein LOC141637825 n=1 Tax=Silene latifolia TaxID=37657 RepID=UPI003D77F17C